MATIPRKRVNISEAEPVESSGLDEFAPENTSTSKPSGTVSSGWVTSNGGGFKKTVKAPYVELKDLKKHDIKILDEVPALKYRTHWVASTRRMYTCLRMWDQDNRLASVEECPLCMAGHRAVARMMVNAVDLSVDRTEVRTFTFGTEISIKLQNYSHIENDDGTFTDIPMNREDRYFTVQRVDVPRTSYDVSLVKSRDLLEDRRKEPLTSEEIAELCTNLYGEEVLWIDSFERVQGYADELKPSDFPTQ